MLVCPYRTTFDANTKYVGGGWFKAVRWHESRDCAGGCFSVTCPRRISLGFASTLEEESRVNSGDRTRRLFSCVLAGSRDLSTDAFIPQYLCCRRDHQDGYYDEARNFAKESTTEGCSVSRWTRGHLHAYKWFSVDNNVCARLLIRSCSISTRLLESWNSSIVRSERNAKIHCNKCG